MSLIGRVLNFTFPGTGSIFDWAMPRGQNVSMSAPVVGSLQLQTSTLGRAIAAIFGKTRIAPNLLWYGDFVAIPHTSTQSGGGKGGGGGEVSQTTYTYQAAGLLGLCEGPIESVMNVWSGKSRSTLAALNLDFFSGSYSQSPASFLTTKHPGEALSYRGIAYLASAAYDLGGNAQLPNHGFEVAGLLAYGSTGQSGKVFTADPATDTLSSTAHGYAAGACVRVSSSGTLPGGLATSLATDFYVVGPAANTLQLSLEPGGAPVDITSAGTGTHTVIRRIPDAEPTAVIAELVTNLHFGLQQPSAILGDFTQAAAGCIANGIFVSPAYIEQQAAVAIIARLAQIANAAPFWSEDVLKLAPYWDAAASGNGATFTPDLAPLYDLGDDDYLDLDQPVKGARSTPADAFNQRSLKFLSRANQYNEVPSEFKDQADIELNGLKQAPELVLHEIADAEVAQKVIDTLGRAGLYAQRNTHAVQVSWRYDLIEPADLLTLTDSAMGLSQQLVRVLEIEELEEGEGGLQLEVEEVNVGAASPAIYASQAAAGFKTDFTVAPGSVNPPLVFDAPGILAVSGFEIWIAVSGASANWGGCNVWVSTDNAEYKQAGMIAGPARYGVLSASFASGADPDTTHTCAVDLSVSRGELAGGTQADADNFSTLSLVGGELIAFETATLTAQYKYDLKDYIRRGVYNTPIGSHASGEAFARCDQALFRYAYDPAFIGKTIYLKFTSFNVYGGGGEDLASVTAYSFTIAGPIGRPSNVGTLSFTDPILSWLAITDANRLGYIVKYQPSGDAEDWTAALPAHKQGWITETRFDAGDIVGGSTRLLVKSIDLSKKEAMAAATLVVDLRPPTPTSFLMSRQPDGTREFTLSTASPPDDLKEGGAHIRYFLGSTGDWAAMTPLHTGFIKAFPFETNQLAAGIYTFAAKNVDRAGNESVSAIFLGPVAIGAPRIAGAIEDERQEPTWPGTKTDCHVDTVAGALLADSTAIWASAATWAAWPQWNKTPKSPIIYERKIDIGIKTRFTPLVTVFADGSQTIQEKHSDDDVGYSSYAATGPVVDARYIWIKVTITGAYPKIYTERIILSASPLVEFIEDQNSASLTGAYRIGVGDIRLPITKIYALIQKVDVTLQSVGAGWSVVLIDKDKTVGPRIKIYDSSNTLADAVFDATVTGIA